MITEQQVQDAKDEFISLVSSNYKKNGGSAPVFALVVEKADQTIPGILVFPLPGELFSSAERKQLLIDKVLPDVAKQVVKEQGYIPLATCFMMEANMWIKQKQKDEEITEEEISDIRNQGAPTDIIMFSFEDKYNETMTIFEVEKKSFVTPEGEITKETELIPRPELGMDDNNHVIMKGLFTGLFKIFWKAE